jgi:hypothetical protein
MTYKRLGHSESFTCEVKVKKMRNTIFSSKHVNSTDGSASHLLRFALHCVAASGRLFGAFGRLCPAQIAAYLRVAPVPFVRLYQ